MTRRAALKWLHWSHSALMGLVLLAPSTPVIALYGVVALVWSGAFGLATSTRKPGPKLEGVMRQVHIWGHHGLYLVTALAGLSALGQLMGLDTPLRGLILVLLASGALHAIFHLWRHTTLMDGALKLILPKATHGIL